MALTISFELSDTDKDYFLKMARKAQDAVAKKGLSAESITKAARGIFDQAGDAELPDFISTRLNRLETLVNMIEDAEWQLPDEDRSRVLSAMAYFASPKDIIPDQIPGIGFLDDAIMIELMVENLEHEITAYHEFCEFRSAEEDRRRNQGLDTHVGRDDWLADQRAVLHSRMRERRAGLSPSPVHTIRLW